LSRRVFLGGGLVLCFFPRAARAGQDWRLTAEAASDGRCAYGGQSPGPTIRARVGRPCRIEIANALAAPTSLSVAGLRLPYARGARIAPGGRAKVEFAPTEPGFGLYLPYEPADQLAAGLFGPVVVDEVETPAVDLDAVVVFSVSGQQWRVNADAKGLDLAAAPGGRVRLRLANAAPDLVLAAKTSGPEAAIVAIDGQPCPPFAPLRGEFPLCPSARFELMFDLDKPFELTLGGAQEPALRIAPRGERVAARGPFAGLSANPRLPQEIALEKARQVKITLTKADAGFALNGGGRKPLFTVARGAPVSLTLVNETAEPQTLRLEGHSARILHARDDGWDPYWRDALLIGPGRTLHAAFVADNPGPWPLASASPERRAKGLAGRFKVA
jgi:FtsP/CotA-like multicopper oxidase with cupredoxin domain